ncbi:MAG: patatin-like phospholipase family protein, partial [Alphaproteobacteria bacterium]|nr:patatin-like phospholipase family protein [Alphaproteobacteria bacterium]
MALFKRRARAANDAPAPPTDGRRPVSLALQGGGAHGAFQWGVLDRLLEDDRLDVRVVTAASAGAMNGAALISGLAAGG